MRLRPYLAIACLGPVVVTLATLGSLAAAHQWMPAREKAPSDGTVLVQLLRRAVETDLRSGQLLDARELVDVAGSLGSIEGARLYGADGRQSFESRSLRGTATASGSDAQEVLSELRPEGAQLPAPMPGMTRRMLPLRGLDGTLLGGLEVVQRDPVAKGPSFALAPVAWLSAVGLAALLTALLLRTERAVSRPLPALASSLRTITSEDLAARVPDRERGEMREIVCEVNRILDSREALYRNLRRAQEEKARAERRLARTERLANVGQVAAGLAHEVGAPLCVIRGHAESLLARAAGDPAMEHGLTTIAQQIDRITGIVSDVLAFARVRPPRLEPIDARDVVARLVDLTRQHCEAQGVRVQVSGPEDLPRIVADSYQVEQALLNLVLNALDAMPDGGDLRVTITSMTTFDPEGTAKERPHVAITVEDTGVGIAPEHLPHLFEPFFTLKLGQPQAGTGLGLSIADAIMREHRGWMRVQSSHGKGTRMTAYFPVAAAITSGCDKKDTA